MRKPYNESMIGEGGEKGEVTGVDQSVPAETLVTQPLKEVPVDSSEYLLLNRPQDIKIYEQLSANPETKLLATMYAETLELGDECAEAIARVLAPL